MLSVESHSNATVNKLIASSLSSSEAIRSSAPSVKTLPSGGFRVVPRFPGNPSFMKVLIILYYDKLTRSEPPTS